MVMTRVLTRADTSWYGKEPCVVEDTPEEKESDEGRASRSNDPTQTVLDFPVEKAPLVSESSSVDNEKMARRPSPGAQV